MGCRWNHLDEPVFVAVSFFGLTVILYLEKFYALCTLACEESKILDIGWSKLLKELALVIKQLRQFVDKLPFMAVYGWVGTYPNLESSLEFSHQMMERF